MARVKIFSDDEPQRLEERIDEWFSDWKKDSLTVMEMQLSCTDENIVVMIWYDEDNNW